MNHVTILNSNHSLTVFPYIKTPMAHLRTRLSEPELAQLYLQTEAPLCLDNLLQGITPPETGQIAMHDAISGQTPDMALLSLSLCGAIIVRDFPHDLKDGWCGPLLRELLVDGEDNLCTVGMLWLNANCYGIEPDPKADLKIIKSIPDRLRILSSIFMELRDALADHSARSAYHAVNTLFYQAESHADLADKFVENLGKVTKKAKKVDQVIKDQIPLPFDLLRPQMGAEIVSFSLFAKR